MAIVSISYIGMEPMTIKNFAMEEIVSISYIGMEQQHLVDNFIITYNI